MSSSSTSSTFDHPSVPSRSHDSPFGEITNPSSTPSITKTTHTTALSSDSSSTKSISKISTMSSSSSSSSSSSLTNPSSSSDASTSTKASTASLAADAAAKAQKSAKRKEILKTVLKVIGYCALILASLTVALSLFGVMPLIGKTITFGLMFPWAFLDATFKLNLLFKLVGFLAYGAICAGTIGISIMNLRDMYNESKEKRAKEVEEASHSASSSASSSSNTKSSSSSSLFKVSSSTSVSSGSLSTPLSSSSGTMVSTIFSSSPSVSPITAPSTTSSSSSSPILNHPTPTPLTVSTGESSSASASSSESSSSSAGSHDPATPTGLALTPPPLLSEALAAAERASTASLTPPVVTANTAAPVVVDVSATTTSVPTATPILSAPTTSSVTLLSSASISPIAPTVASAASTFPTKVPLPPKVYSDTKYYDKKYGVILEGQKGESIRDWWSYYRNTFERDAVAERIDSRPNCLGLKVRLELQNRGMTISTILKNAEKVCGPLPIAEAPVTPAAATPSEIPAIDANSGL